MIDWTSSSTQFFVYYGTQFFGTFFRQRRDKTTGALVSTASLSGVLSAGGTLRASFVSVAAMNRAAQSEFVIAVGPFSANPTTTQIARTINQGVSFTTFASGLSSSITAMFYSFDGTTLYAAAAAAESSGVARCTTLPFSCSQVGTIPRHVNHLAVDPQNSNVVFAATIAGGFRYNSPGFFTSIDGGATWVDGSVPGSLLATASLGGAVTFINSPTANTVVVGTSNGVLIPDAAVGGWKQLARGLPKVAVTDMLYEAADDTLVLVCTIKQFDCLSQLFACLPGIQLTIIFGSSFIRPRLDVACGFYGKPVQRPAELLRSSSRRVHL
jgi:hypothetical protein